MKAKRGGCGWAIPWLLAAMSLLIAHPSQVIAAENTQQISLSLNAGESKVIDNLNKESTPDIQIVSNPQALLVHSEEPGKLVLLGAETGEWKISVERADGQKVTYDVTVHAIRDASNPLKPGEAPAAISDNSTAASSTAAHPLDSGTGPVAKASSPAAGAGKVASAATTNSTWTGPSSATAAATSDPAAALSGGVMQSQTASAAVSGGKKFRNDPTVVASGEGYSTEGVAASGRHYLPADGISLRTGTSQVIDFTQRLRRVSIADTKVADVQVINPYELNLIAHQSGFTTLAVWTGQGGRYEERQVRVDPTGKQQVMLNTVVAELNLNNIENQGVNYTAALQKYGISMVGMPGAVATPYDAQSKLNIQGTGGASSGGILPPGGDIIPLLLSQGLTYGLTAQNSNVLEQTFFQFLENHNMARILAEPRLLANSGEKATFLSGGEIPIVVAQALNTSVVFKQFGTSVTFLPTVVGLNQIELLVKPEVSQPNYAQGVQLFGFTVPAFVTRRAQTMVRLRDGQTLIIAGLMLTQKNEQIDKVPYLGDIPYLGGLFRTTSWSKSTTDLMMSVTPHIVRPLPPGAQMYKPSSHPGLTYSEIRTRSFKTPNPARPRF